MKMKLFLVTQQILLISKLDLAYVKLLCIVLGTTYNLDTFQVIILKHHLLRLHSIIFSRESKIHSLSGKGQKTSTLVVMCS